MKKVLIIGLILCFLSVLGCGGAYADEVILEAGISEEPLSIKLPKVALASSPLNVPYVCFSKELSLDELHNIIQEQNPNTMIVSLNDGMLVKKRNSNAFTDFFWIYENGEVGGLKWFLMDNLRCQYQKKGSTDADIERVEILFPKFLINEERLRPLMYLQKDIELLCYDDVEIQDFYDFYVESGYYEVELVGDEVIILSLKPNEFSNERENKYKLKRNIIISMVKKDNKDYIKVTER
ncbi:MAG: hypothetical protein K6E53_15250 [Lachnospiraceae bacterium]|nr:hypothetical protein [Lachnospiraceae bacterium]